MERRGFFRQLFAFVPFILSFLGITALGARFISPTSKEQKYRKVFATSLHNLALNEALQVKDLKGKELLVVRTGEREVKALSTVCTHLGCSVHWKSDKGIFFCPCHDGVFDRDGKVVSGPPPRDLEVYDVALEGDNVYVYFAEKEVT